MQSFLARERMMRAIRSRSFSSISSLPSMSPELASVVAAGRSKTDALAEQLGAKAPNGNGHSAPAQQPEPVADPGAELAIQDLIADAARQFQEADTIKELNAAYQPVRRAEEAMGPDNYQTLLRLYKERLAAIQAGNQKPQARQPGEDDEFDGQS